jgi:predicted RND superfamily exporter protein
VNLKKYGIYLFITLLCVSSLFTANDILTNGLTKTTILDEFRSDDPVLIKYNSYKKHFDYEKEITLIINNKNETKLSTKDIEYINEIISKKLNTFTGIKRFSHLGAIKLPSFDKKSQTVSVKPIFDNTTNLIDTKQYKKLKGLKSFESFPISKNEKSYLIHIELKQMQRSEIMLQTKALFHYLREFNKDEKLNMSIIGVEPFRYSIYDEVFRGYLILLPFILLLIFLISFIIFKNFEAVITIFLTLGFSFVSTASIIYIIDRSFSPFSSFSLLFVFVVGTSDIIHLLANLRESKSLRESIKNIYTPCFLTSLTTFIGLSSLIFSPFKTLQNFGIYGSIGILMCFIVTFYILPHILELNLFSRTRSKLINSQIEQKPFNTDRIMNITHYSKTILLISISLIMIFIHGSMQIKFEDDFYRKFKTDHPISVAIEKIQKDFGHLGSIDLFINKSLLTEKIFSIFLNKIEMFKEVRAIKSSLDLKNDFNTLVTEPQIAEKLYSYLSLLDLPFSFSSKLNPDYERVIIQLSDLSVNTVTKASHKIQNLINENNNKMLIKLSGFSLIRTHFVNNLKTSYLVSLKISFILIFIVFIIYLKSFKLAIIAMLPNIAPILAITATMGYFGINADMNLPLICSIALGLCVDDTIHFLHQFKHLKSKGLSIQESTGRSVSKVSLALITTSVILSVSLLIFSFGNIQLFSQLGVFISICAFIALFYDLIVLPVIIRLAIKDN